MAADNIPVRQPDRPFHENTAYADEGDEVTYVAPIPSIQCYNIVVAPILSQACTLLAFLNLVSDILFNQVVERVLGWIMKLFPGGPSKRRTSKLL